MKFLNRIFAAAFIVVLATSQNTQPMAAFRKTAMAGLRTAGTGFKTLGTNVGKVAGSLGNAAGDTAIEGLAKLQSGQQIAASALRTAGTGTVTGARTFGRNFAASTRELSSAAGDLAIDGLTKFQNSNKMASLTHRLGTAAKAARTNIVNSTREELALYGQNAALRNSLIGKSFAPVENGLTKVTEKLHNGRTWVGKVAQKDRENIARGARATGNAAKFLATEVQDTAAEIRLSGRQTANYFKSIPSKISARAQAIRAAIKSAATKTVATTKRAGLSTIGYGLAAAPLAYYGFGLHNASQQENLSKKAVLAKLDEHAQLEIENVRQVEREKVDREVDAQKVTISKEIAINKRAAKEAVIRENKGRVTDWVNTETANIDSEYQEIERAAHNVAMAQGIQRKEAALLKPKFVEKKAEILAATEKAKAQVEEVYKQNSPSRIAEVSKLGGSTTASIGLRTLLLRALSFTSPAAAIGLGTAQATATVIGYRAMGKNEEAYEANNVKEQLGNYVNTKIQRTKDWFYNAINKVGAQVESKLRSDNLPTASTVLSTAKGS